ncbi:hypothetical protein [Streptomyces roseolus]
MGHTSFQKAKVVTTAAWSDGQSFAATHLAAEADDSLTMPMPMPIHAVQREYQKLGRLTPASEFGRRSRLSR